MFTKILTYFSILIVIFASFSLGGISPIESESASIKDFIPKEFLSKDIANGLIEPRLDSTGRSLLIKSIILAPIGIALLIMAGIIAFFPIATVTGRMRGAFENTRAVSIASTVLTSDECIERIACEVSKMSKRDHELNSWISKTLPLSLKTSRWGEKISRGLFSSSVCKNFICHPITTFKRALNANK